MKISAPGFTLIELLVVIAIMGIISTVAFSNYKSFGEDQSLKNAVLDLQSQLRTAQTNAISNVKCGDAFSTIWQVEATTTTVYLKCPNLGLTKGVKFDDNIRVDTVSGIGTCPLSNQFVIGFDSLSGRINLGGTNCTSLNISLKNSKTQNIKSLIIEQGGRIYAQ